MLDLSKLGKKVKETREALEFSQEFVASQVGITRQTLIAIESSSKKKLDSFILFKLADLYGVSISDLFREDVPVSSFQDVVIHMRKSKSLSESEIDGLMKFRKVCKNFDFLKTL